MGSDVAEAQIDDLSDAEVDVLLEIYEVLRLTPDNGRRLDVTGNMYVWSSAWTASPPEIGRHSPRTPPGIVRR